MPTTIIPPEKSITDTCMIFDVATKDLPNIENYKHHRTQILTEAEKDRIALIEANKTITDPLLVLFQSNGVGIDRITPCIIDKDGYTLEFITHKGKVMQRYYGKVNGTKTEIWDTVKLTPQNNTEYQKKLEYTCPYQGCDFKIERWNADELTDSQKSEVNIHLLEHHAQ